MDNHNNMEYRIGLEKQNKRNDQVTELILDNCRASQISGLTDDFVNLETLSLINVGLVTLKGFPKLPKLKKLELSDNRLTGGLNLLHGSPKLQHLNLSGNRIKDLADLEPLKEFHDLVNLDLYNCEVTTADDYRKKVFELLPNLSSLDGYDRDENEVADSDESEDEDIENRITREDNELDDDDEDDDDGDEDDDEGDNSESEFDEESYNGMELNYNEISDEEDDEDDIDDEDSEEEESDDDSIEPEPTPGRPAVRESQGEGAPLGSLDSVSANVGSVENGEDDHPENADDSRGHEHIEDEEFDYDDEDDEDDDEGDPDDGDGSDLKQLQKDLSEDQESDDDDFEPTHEPEERDYEIDPEDDGDVDAEEDSSALLSTSNTTATPQVDEGVVSEETKARGEKRKHEDVGGDEEVEEK